MHLKLFGIVERNGGIVMEIRPMVIRDYDEVYALWLITSKQALSSADGRTEIGR